MAKGKRNLEVVMGYDNEKAKPAALLPVMEMERVAVDFLVVRVPRGVDRVLNKVRGWMAKEPERRRRG